MTNERPARRMSSLRLRLAIGGFVAVYVPLVVLVSIVLVSEEADSTSGPGGSTEVTRSTSEWAIATAIALLPIAAAASWWWAGRAVRPLVQITQTVAGIEAGRLDRRLDLDDAPAEVAQLADQLDRMLGRLDDAAAVQSQLIEDASHEFRTPLTLLMTNADIALSSPDDVEGLLDGLRRSKTTAARLASTVDELLVDARGRARTINREPVDLRTLVDETVGALRPIAAVTDVRLETDGPTTLPWPVDGDAMRRALTNLVDNAVRHSPPGATVSITLGSDDAGVSVTVVDEGPGITPDLIDRIFDRHWRADQSGEGSGIGLSIVRQIARAHGGDVSVRCPGPSGRGSAFTLHLAGSPSSLCRSGSPG